MLVDIEPVYVIPFLKLKFNELVKLLGVLMLRTTLAFFFPTPLSANDTNIWDVNMIVKNNMRSVFFIYCIYTNIILLTKDCTYYYSFVVF